MGERVGVRLSGVGTGTGTHTGSNWDGTGFMSRLHEFER